MKLATTGNNNKKYTNLTLFIALKQKSKIIVDKRKKEPINRVISRLCAILEKSRLRSVWGNFRYEATTCEHSRTGTTSGFLHCARPTSPRSHFQFLTPQYRPCITNNASTLVFSVQNLSNYFLINIGPRDWLESPCECGIEPPGSISHVVS